MQKLKERRSGILHLQRLRAVSPREHPSMLRRVIDAADAFFRRA
jgi:hypothetical protein